MILRNLKLSKHLLLCLFCLLTCLQAKAEIDIKLNCQISLLKSFSTGISEKITTSVIFDVYQSKDVLTILSSNDEFSSVANKKSKNIIEVVNASDNNRWDLKNKRITERNTTLTTHIKIDRNSGQIFYSHEIFLNSGWINSQGSGNCEKIDTSKKKF